jgi:nucleoid DNA-binding protein
MRVDGGFVQPFMDFSRMDREVSDVLVQALLNRMRQALLDGHSLDVPTIGELTIHQSRPRALVNPTSGQTRELGGERTILFRPDRTLVRALNAARNDDDVAPDHHAPQGVITRRNNTAD